LVFFGKEKKAPSPVAFGKESWAPVGILAALAIVGGFVELPPNWGGVSLFSDFLSPALAAPELEPGGFAGSVASQLIVAIASLAGIYVSYLLFAHASGRVKRRANRPAVAALSRLALDGWGFDRIYQVVFVRPFIWLTRTNKDDVIDSAFTAVAWSSRQASGLLSRTQTGKLRYYVAVAALGVLVFVALGVFR
jgi:NADH-quinone oxidoreductase subunit L